MSVLTEAKIRKLFRDNEISEHGTFELAADQKLTPAAKGFLSDHHVTVLSASASARTAKHATERSAKTIRNLEDSVVYSHLFRLIKLYPSFLTSQRELYLGFQTEKCEQVGCLLQVLENMVGYHILEDISLYGHQFLSHAELQAIRVNKQLDQQSVPMGYQEPTWKLALYTTYTEVVVLRKELEQLGNPNEDIFLSQVCQLFKSLEVLLWLITSEE